MKHKAGDFLLGLFVLAGLAVIGYMILTFAGMSTRDRYEVFVLFDDVGGLIKEAPVRYAGVQRGTVSRIIPWGEPVKNRPDIPRDKVKVVLSLDDTTPLRTRDEIKIVAVSLLGEMAVQIVPGPLSAAELPRDSSTVIRGGRATGLLDLVGELLGPFPEVMKNLESLTSEQGPLVQTAMSLNRVVSESLPGVITDVRATAEEAEKLLAESREKISELIGSMNQTVKLSSDLIDNLTQLTAEGGSLTQTVEGVKGVVDDVRRVARALYPTVANITAGKGGLGKLINDPAWYDSFSKFLAFVTEHGVPLNLHPEKTIEKGRRAADQGSRELAIWTR